MEAIEVLKIIDENISNIKSHYKQNKQDKLDKQVEYFYSTCLACLSSLFWAIMHMFDKPLVRFRLPAALAPLALPIPWNRTR